MKNEKTLTIDEQIAKLKREIGFVLIFNIAIYLLVLLIGILVWQPAFYFFVGTPASLFQVIVTIKHNKKAISKLKSNQKESQLSACEVEHEKERSIND